MNIRSLCFASLVVPVFVSGCAVGNRYDYGASEVSLPIQSSGEIAVSVIDNREYVVAGKKPENFVGIQRGGFGNPFNVTTSSGRPLASEFSGSLKKSLEKSGFQVKEIYLSSPDSSVIAKFIQKDGSERNIVLKVNEWKTDAMMSLRLIYDLELFVYNNQGQILAFSQDEGDEVISGAGFEGGNSSSAASAYETKIGRLFNKPEVREQLQR